MERVGRVTWTVPQRGQLRESRASIPNNMPSNEEQGDERQLPSVDPEDFPEPRIIDPTPPARKQGPQKEEPQPDED
jgi:hypothetical protein